MRTAKAWGILVVLAAATLATASPIYGTWTGEVNGKTLSMTFTRTVERTAAKMVTSGREAAITGLQMKKASTGLYPLTYSFRGASLDGSGNTVSYEMVQTSPTEATLRNLDQPDAAVVKLTKK